MSQIFDKIRVGTTKRSTFDLSHKQVTTSDFGYLLPICYRDMVPNDDFVVNPRVFTRLAPLYSPAFSSIKCRIHHFFVPYRILYPHWDMFITQDSNNNTVPPYFTYYTLKSALQTDPQYSSTSGLTLPRGTYGRLMSNLGLNPMLFLYDDLPSTERISAFPFLAYYRIWMDWFADASIYDHPALVASFNNDIANGGSLIAGNTKYLLTRNVCYKKDYFTTAKLNPQDGTSSLVGVDVAGQSLNPALTYGGGSSTDRSYIQKLDQVSKVGLSGFGSNATSAIGEFTIEALRAANSLQKWLERNNFVGTKLINRMLAHFGIEPTPERLDMAEFINGDSFDIRIGDITSTSTYESSSGDVEGLAWQAGKGVGGKDTDGVRYHAKEHGIFMSVMSILPDTAYYQGISRMWQKGVTGDPLDYYTPEFENLGYQEVLNKEVYVPDSASAHLSYAQYNGNSIFGYVPRYAEYKFHNDILAGDFVGTVQSSSQPYNPLDSWHSFRHLSYTDNNPLALNENFVELDNHNNDYDRIFQVTRNDYDHFYFNIECDVKATRPMTGFTAPSLDNNESDGAGQQVNLPYGGTRL